MPFYHLPFLGHVDAKIDSRDPRPAHRIELDAARQRRLEARR
jgi:hypothetical protein